MNDLDQILKRNNDLILEGIPAEEIYRTLMEEFSAPPLDLSFWPNSVTGHDPTVNIDDKRTSREPPAVRDGVDANFAPWQLDYPFPQNFAPADSSVNWLGLANTEHLLNSQDEEGWLGKSSIPPWQYPIEDDQTQYTELRHGVDGKIIKKNNPISFKKKDERVSEDKSLPAIIDAEYNTLLPKDVPHMVIAPPEFPMSPAMTVGTDPMETEEIEDDEDDDLIENPLEEIEPLLAKYHYRGHDDDDICKAFHMKVYDLNKIKRPVPPSEGRGFTNTHPNCKCWWEDLKTTKMVVGDMDERMTKHVQHVHRHIGQKARHGNLHKVLVTGRLSPRTMKRNPLHEAISGLRDQFDWLTPDYYLGLKNVPIDGSWYLIRAAGEAITDHRSEGESHRRWLKGEEIAQFTRTGIGKGTDINHNPSWRTGGKIYDGEYDPITNEAQFLLLETDTTIIKAIDTGIITAVSINAGPPRTEAIECPSCDQMECECFLVPRGLILGELDDIAFTYVVTDPNGLWWKGNRIDKATPGIKTTAIEKVL